MRAMDVRSNPKLSQSTKVLVVVPASRHGW